MKSADVGIVFHGTTVATNAMLTGRTSRVAIEIPATDRATAYLRTKKEKMGHLLELKPR